MSAPLVDPTAAPVGRGVKLAPRPLRLDGLRIGLVENTEFNSETLLLRLAERLGRRHGMAVARVDARADRLAEEVLALLREG